MCGLLMGGDVGGGRIALMFDDNFKAQMRAFVM